MCAINSCRPRRAGATARYAEHACVGGTLGGRGGGVRSGPCGPHTRAARAAARAADRRAHQHGQSALSSLGSRWRSTLHGGRRASWLPSGVDGRAARRAFRRSLFAVSHAGTTPSGAGRCSGETTGRICGSAGGGGRAACNTRCRCACCSFHYANPWLVLRST